jgi:hypothetical protein
MLSRTFGLAAVVATTVLPLATTAHASVCSNGTTGSTSDVTLTIGTTTYTPVTCADGLVQPNKGQDAATLTTNMNTLFGTSFHTQAVVGSTLPAFQGIQFAVTADLDQKSGAWHLTWADTNGSQPLNLPIAMDFDIGFLGGDNGATYEFKDVILPNGPNSAAGTFKITFLNGGGNNPGLGNVVVSGALDPNQPVVSAAEPTGLAVLGVGMLGLCLVRRGRSARAA